jgi:hypothetical protein
MTKTSVVAALAACAIGGTVQAQTACPCNGGLGTQVATAAELQTLLSNKMVCATVGSEQWQEWHNGATSGPVVDYKRGPGDTVDPAATVGSYAIAGDATITYTYGSASYRYAVCRNGTATTFCGAAFGGRDITGATVSATPGLQSCASITPASASVLARPLIQPPQKKK